MAYIPLQSSVSLIQNSNGTTKFSATLQLTAPALSGNRIVTIATSSDANCTLTLSSSGIEGTAVGVNAQSTGAFTSLAASGAASFTSTLAVTGVITGNAAIRSTNGTIIMSILQDGVAAYVGTQSNHNVIVIRNGGQVGVFTTSGLDSCPIGQSGPQGGAFTILSSTNTTTLASGGGLITLGNAALSTGGFNLTFYSYDTATQRGWVMRDDSGVNRFRFSRGATDYWFWDVLKVAASDSVNQLSWRCVSQADWTIGSTAIAAITGTGLAITGAVTASTTIQAAAASGYFLGGNLFALFSSNQTKIYSGTSGTVIFDSSGAISYATINSVGMTITGGSINQTKSNYYIAVGTIYQYDAASGGLYLGFAGGTSIIRSVADNSGTAAPISLQSGNGTQIVSITSTSVTLSANIGIALSGTGKATQTQAPSSGSDLCNKTYVDAIAGGSTIINVKNYGATGNGSTDDTASIVAAMAVMTNYSTLYFPSGKYKISLNTLIFTYAITHITIMGDGRSSVLYNTDTTPAANHYMMWFLESTGCTDVTVRDLSIVCSATSRVSGAHGLVMSASRSIISNVFITGTGDFGYQVSSATSNWIEDVQVVNCQSVYTQGDGFHFSGVKDAGLYNCIADSVGDDGVGIGYDVAGYSPERIEVVGFQAINPGVGGVGGVVGGSGCGIRIFDGAVDVHVTGGSIKGAKEAALHTGRFSSTSAYNTRIKIEGLKAYGCLGSMYGQIDITFTNQVSVSGCWSEAPTNNACYAFLDCNYLTVSGNTAKDGASHGFMTDDGSTSNVAGTWSYWTISGNMCFGAPTLESYYFSPNSTKVLSNLIITGNAESGQSYTYYIKTNYLGGVCKINNNTSLGGKTICNGLGAGCTGAVGTVPTTANNN